MTIRKRISIILFACSITAVFLTGILALYGVEKSAGKAIQVGNAIGSRAADSSRDALLKRMQSAMQTAVKDKTARVDAEFEQISMAVKLLAAQMTDIVSHPQNYAVRSVSEPRKENGGKLAAQLYYSEHIADRKALQKEISITANIQDFLLHIYSSNPVIISAYVGAKNGFYIAGDPYSDNGLTPEGKPLPFTASSRPWYLQAQQAGHLIFTDVMIDAIGGELDITCAAPYKKNGEFAGAVGIDISVSDATILTNQIAESGFCFIVNQEGRVTMSSCKEGEVAVNVNNIVDLRKTGNDSLSAAVKDMLSGSESVRTVQIDGKQYYIAYAPLKITGWAYAAAVEMDEVTAPVRQSYADIQAMTQSNIAVLHKDMWKYRFIIFIFVMLLVLVFVAAGWKLADRITRPLLRLKEGVLAIADGNLDLKLDIHTGDEIENLAVSFNSMTNELKSYIKNLEKVTADKQRIATELNVATEIQKNMLPSIFPPYPDRHEFDIYADMHPAKEVGGDFYDFYLADANHLVVTIADVSDKGVPAALYMVIAKTILKNFTISAAKMNDLASVMYQANNQLSQNNKEMMFVTVFMGILDIQTGKFVYVNAGHNPPLVCHQNGQGFQFLPAEKNRVMGICENFNFKQQELVLSPKDVLFLYTDGITEAMNKDGKQFLAERLQQSLNTVPEKCSCCDLLKIVHHAVSEYVQNAPQSDDMTMLGIRYTGLSENEN